jgi:hypothetical protein
LSVPPNGHSKEGLGGGVHELAARGFVSSKE